MAIITSSIAYSGRKKLGTIVLRVIRGQLIASQHQPHVFNPRTPSQVAQRDKMSAIVLAYRSASGIVQAGMIRVNKHGSKYNKYVQLNIESATRKVGDNWEVDYSLLKISNGTLSNVEYIQRQVDGNNVLFVYNGGSLTSPTNADDEIWAGVIIPGFEDSLAIKVSTRGVNNTVELDLGYVPAGQTVYCYAFAVNKMKKDGSVTSYLGNYTTE